MTEESIMVGRINTLSDSPYPGRVDAWNDSFIKKEDISGMASFKEAFNRLTTAEYSRTYAVGDIHSKAKGSGARANSGKTDWSLMSLTQIAYLLSLDSWPAVFTEIELIKTIGKFQEGKITARQLMVDAVAYNWNRVDAAGPFDHKATLMESLHPVIAVWQYGLKKYAAFNWAKGMPWSVPIGCMMRHIEYDMGENWYDDESKELHSAHVVCNAMMLDHYQLYYLEGDDRPLYVFEA